MARGNANTHCVHFALVSHEQNYVSHLLSYVLLVKAAQDIESTIVVNMAGAKFEKKQ